MSPPATAIDPKARGDLEEDLHALIDKVNVAGDSGLVIPSEYIEVVVAKRD